MTDNKTKSRIDQIIEKCKKQIGYQQSSKNEIKETEIIQQAHINHNDTNEYVNPFQYNQKDILFGIESEKYKHTPKLIYKILERLIFVKNKFNVDLLSFFNSLCAIEEWNSEHEQVLSIMKVKFSFNIRKC